MCSWALSFETRGPVPMGPRPSGSIPEGVGTSLYPSRYGRPFPGLGPGSGTAEGSVGMGGSAVLAGHEVAVLGVWLPTGVVQRCHVLYGVMLLCDVRTYEL